MCFYTERFILRKCLVWLLKLAIPKSAAWAHRLESQRSNDAVQVQRHSAGSIPPSWRPVFFLKTLTVWVRPTHILEYNLLYSKLTDLNVNLTQKTALQPHPEVLQHIPGHCSLAKVIYKFNITSLRRVN